ncbi:MAG TPA: SAM-dependent methyltransferase, partial [Chthoniobacterales bacterium]
MNSDRDLAHLTLADRLREQIKRSGPITFHDWMQAALYDERDGYYCRADRIRQGRTGDYRTAPETSPLFGATFAKYFAQIYVALKSPKQLTIVEVGAGRGDFACALLNTLQRFSPAIFAVTRYLIDESRSERAALQERLREFEDHYEFRRLAEVDEPFAAAIIFS